MRAWNDRHDDEAGWRGLPRRARRLLAVAVVAGVVAAAFVTASMVGAATAPVTVSMTVPSAVNITNQCTDPTAYGLGTVLPGSTATSATAAGKVCRIGFGSSNDTSMLRIAQQDGNGSAMTTADPPAINARPALGAAGHVNRAAMANANVGLAVGRNASIRRTVNGGVAWDFFNAVTMTGWWNDVDVDPADQQSWVVVGGASGQPHVLEATNVVSSAPAAPAWSDKSAALVAGGWPALLDVNAVAVVSASTWIVCGSYGYVGTTNNSGSSFTVFTLPGFPDCNDVDAASASNIYLESRSAMFRSTTGGLTAGSWTTMTAPADLAPASMDVRDTTHVWLSDQNGGFEKWNGTSWQGVRSVSGQHSVAEVLASPGAPDTIWAPLRDGAGVARSTDAGVTWSVLPVSPDVPMTAVAPWNSTSAAAFGEAASSFRTTTATAWTTTSTVTAQPAWWGIAADPTNGQRVVAVGTGGSIMRSTDGGATFTSPSSGVTTGLHAVTWTSSTGLWAVGEAGVILRSTDAGATWTQQVDPLSQGLWAISATSDYAAWAVGENGTVLRTTNGGTTWSVVTYPTLAWLRGVVVTSATTAVVAGAQATGAQVEVKRTTNGGSSWTASTTLNTWDVARGLATGDGGAKIYLATSNDGLQVSTDGGATFAVGRSFWSTDTAVTVSGSEIVTGGPSSTSIVTHDGGANWDYTYRGTDEDDLSVAAVDGHGFWVGGAESGISRTKEAASGAVISDFGAGHLWASGTTTNTFGVCVQGMVSATPAPGWSVDGGTCTPVDTDPWAAVPTGATKLAELTSGASGSVDLVWGMRAKTTQPAATYAATVVFEALAPDA